jgi:segregation and condensation protein A
MSEQRSDGTSRLTPIAVESPDAVAVAVGAGEFEVQLPVFAGPLQLLLHLIESRQLDVLTVPLADLADAYAQHLARTPVDVASLSEFVAIAAQLILLKSRRMLPGDVDPVVTTVPEEADEEELRRRLIEYRVLRDAARALGERDLVAPLMRREPRESDLPEAPVTQVAPSLLVEALLRLTAIPEPQAPPPAVVAREITMGMQIRALLEALSGNGSVILQSVLATCRSRTEATVMVMAALELVRRRQVRIAQSTLFGPIVIEVATRPAGGDE